MRPLILSLDGNIGAGKSTLLKALRAAHPEWYFVDEPVDQWMTFKNAEGKSLLQLFYEDKKRWAYTFQHAAILTRANSIEKALHDPSRTSGIVIVERCLETDRNVFAQMLADSGDLDPMEFDLYKNLYAHISKMIPPTSAHIWVNVPPEVCFERTKLRGREGEDAIPLSYFQDLHTVHERWLRNTSVSVCEATTVQEVESFIATLVREGVGQV